MKDGPHRTTVGGKIDGLKIEVPPLHIQYSNRTTRKQQLCGRLIVPSGIRISR